jgi:teichuronic acid biosynthesis glycosyltransferase TuaC
VVQLEALACGKPVVATINGGSEEIITSQEYGLLCKNKNPNEIARNINYALQKKWNRKNIINYAKKFEWNKICKRIKKLYGK